MNTRIPNAVVSFALVAGCAMLPSPAATQPPAKPPELKILDKYAGTWKFEGVESPAEWTPKEVRYNGITVNQWVLDGWFQHHKVTFGDGREGIDIITYDPRKKVFRQWNFMSLGLYSESLGTWDEQTQTLTFKSDLGDGFGAVSTMKFLDKDNREATLIVTDVQGKVYLSSMSKLTRQK